MSRWLIHWLISSQICLTIFHNFAHFLAAKNLHLYLKTMVSKLCHRPQIISPSLIVAKQRHLPKQSGGGFMWAAGLRVFCCCGVHGRSLKRRVERSQVSWDWFTLLPRAARPPTTTKVGEFDSLKVFLWECRSQTICKDRYLYIYTYRPMFTHI